MVFKWKEEHTSLFLISFHNHECLWNTKCESYKNKNVRNRAMEHMIKELNQPLLTIEDIKCKIKTIRTRYSSELTKVLKSEKSGVGIDDIYVPKLYWFKQADLFLRSVCIPRICTPTEILIKREYEDGAEQSNDIDASTDASMENSQRRAGCESLKEKSIPQHFKTSSRKRSSTLAGFETIDKVFDKISTENEEQEHEFDVFCKSLAIQLKKMPFDRALMCQQRLQNVMTEERIYQYRKQQLQIQVTGSSPSTSLSASSHSTPFPSPPL